ncbi:MAG: hypothetical protein QN168_01460 [Armatimonadota bacterium]|nr:hypothetical protein [Armatimonadota bacterium]
MIDISRRLEAFANTLLASHLQRHEYPQRWSCRVAVEGDAVVLTLRRLPDEAVEGREVRPDAPSPTEPWALDILTVLRPAILQTLRDWTGVPATGVFREDGRFGGAPALVCRPRYKRVRAAE